MALEPSNSKLLVYYSLAQIGLEMAAPVALGVGLGLYLGWGPWLAIGGAVVGLIGGMIHLVTLVNRRSPSNSREKPLEKTQWPG